MRLCYSSLNNADAVIAQLHNACRTAQRRVQSKAKGSGGDDDFAGNNADAQLQCMQNNTMQSADSGAVILELALQSKSFLAVMMILRFVLGLKIIPYENPSELAGVHYDVSKSPKGEDEVSGEIT